MNEKLRYAEMLEIPVNTCNITYKPPKKRKRKARAKVDADEVKNELIEKVNAEQPQEIASVDVVEVTEDEVTLTEQLQEQPENTDNAEGITVSIRQAEPKRARKKFGIIAAQLCVIGALIATIFITNALFEGSGINTFFKGVFSTTEVERVDNRAYTEFAPVISAGGGSITLEDGVITTDFVGSMYSPCDGTVSKLTKEEDGKYTLEVTHTERFKTVIEGLTYVYAAEGGVVKANIPVGYVGEKGVTVCFYNGVSQITNFTVNQNAVVWAV